jgi:O-acetyl-ADP-ribose deacetylase (regulator of RNase III)
MMNVDAIVNAARPNLKMGSGLCGAIFRAAGVDRLQAVCDSLAPIQAGEAVITNGFDLSAKYIVHTAVPTHRENKENMYALLHLCYKNSLDMALQHGCKSIAISIISNGVFGCPKSEALTVATKTISDWLNENEMDVSLVIPDKKSFVLSKSLLHEVKSFINSNLNNKQGVQAIKGGSLVKREGRHLEKHARTKKLYSDMSPADMSASLGSLIGNLDEPFSEALLRFIDAKGKTDAEVYKRANIDRRLFSKIRTGGGYMPSKKTVIALAVALELTMNETRALLERAGFALSRSVMFDVIIECFISHGWYDIYEINNVLFEYDQPLLGG